MSSASAQHRFGLLLMFAGAAVDSTSGLFTRLLATDGFTTASGRGFAAFLFLLAVLVVTSGRQSLRRLFGIGIFGAAFIALNALGMVMNILSLSLTSVANFFMIFATAPFVAAIAARVVLGEKLDLATMLAAIAGFIGIAVMMFAGARSGGLLGDLLALGCVLAYSALVLIMRHHRSMDILPTITLTVLASGLLALPFADFSQVGLREAGLLAVFGAVQLAIGNLLIFSAASRIPAAQSGLLGILNAGFAPLWVFLFLGEVPPPATLLGGAIILGAAIAHLVWTLTRPGGAPQVGQTVL
jgi:drug/metabolite transporter (DMT)-like permease